MSKPRIHISSLPWLLAIAEYVHGYKRQDRDVLLHAPSDVLDGWATRVELDDLIRRRLLTVIPYDDVSESDRERMPLCGSTWTVHFTDRAIQAFWPSARS
jgi:hypothetical protein